MASPIYASGASPLPPSSFYNGPVVIGRGRDDEGRDCESCRSFRRLDQLPAAERELIAETGIERARLGWPVIRAVLLPADRYPARDSQGRAYALAAYRCPWADRREGVVLVRPAARCDLMFVPSSCRCAVGHYWLNVIDPNLSGSVLAEAPIPVVPGDLALEVAR
ncbi:MAG: hypothetical protein WCC64_09590 [Aliidongia sp.]